MPSLVLPLRARTPVQGGGSPGRVAPRGPPTRCIEPPKTRRDPHDAMRRIQQQGSSGPSSRRNPLTTPVARPRNVVRPTRAFSAPAHPERGGTENGHGPLPEDLRGLLRWQTPLPRFRPAPCRRGVKVQRPDGCRGRTPRPCRRGMPGRRKDVQITTTELSLSPNGVLTYRSALSSFSHVTPSMR